ncbi:hypothetical protein N2599_34130 (plasmid) [Rhizobium sullae]|uniref:Uncharacterized protein n=1 Tax=Rhizobium sullae TaxID=50338 RepID=A0ABY5XZ93_RHISU|nr:hypothetical protein [Rhizobium sullae]UWU19287.1 hypothetical protein N2599_34130 [Rhizobium sullae]
MLEKRRILKLRTDDLVPPEEDRKVELHTFDVLLPCRRYDVSYKVAVLGQMSPTLEFLMRLVKSVDGIGEDEARQFFGYNRVEMEFVLGEGTTPGYIERRANRLWLTTAGEALFSNGDDGPAIYSVENRRNSFGFDQLAIAPQTHMHLDQLEMNLPDLSLDVYKGGGRASKVVEDRFHYFFRELADREDRDRLQRRDLYAIGSAIPGDRFQVPVRIKVVAQASSPSVVEADLTSWRSDQEMSDRPEIEQAIGRFLSELRLPKQEAVDAHAYRLLTELAPDFFKEFTISSGLSIGRYWREAVSRAGEPRTDRQTIALVGSLLTQGNIERILRVVDYGLRQSEPPKMVLSVPPVTKHWGATTLLRDLNALIRMKLRHSDGDESSEPETCCVCTEKVPKYISSAFDNAVAVAYCSLPPSLEIYLMPGLAAVALVHAPIGPAGMGAPAPLGFATFDPAVIRRIENLIGDEVAPRVTEDARRSAIERAIAPRAALEAKVD